MSSAAPALPATNFEQVSAAPQDEQKEATAVTAGADAYQQSVCTCCVT